jgi:hypothetical protein
MGMENPKLRILWGFRERVPEAVFRVREATLSSSVPSLPDPPGFGAED